MFLAPTSNHGSERRRANDAHAKPIPGQQRREHAVPHHMRLRMRRTAASDRVQARTAQSTRVSYQPCRPCTTPLPHLVGRLSEALRCSVRRDTGQTGPTRPPRFVASFAWDRLAWCGQCGFRIDAAVCGGAGTRTGGGVTEQTASTTRGTVPTRLGSGSSEPSSRHVVMPTPSHSHTISRVARALQSRVKFSCEVEGCESDLCILCGRMKSEPPHEALRCSPRCWRARGCGYPTPRRLQ